MQAFYIWRDSENKIEGVVRRDSLLAAGVILLYCLAYFSIRLLVSLSMEVDESEQFIDGSVFSLGYPNQAPLYTWIVKAAFSLFGRSIVTLMVIKYGLLFSLYFILFLVARRFWDARASLIIAGALLIFPTYSYEAHRDLSHTILVSVIAVLTCLLYIRILQHEKTIYYSLVGVFSGLGILSKYNFALFIAALLLSSLSFMEGRRVISNKKIFLSLLCGALVLLPHFLWLVQNDFPSFHYALNRSKAGELGSVSSLRIFSIAASSYLEVIIFFLISTIFFFRHISTNENREKHIMIFLRWLVFYGLMIPLLAIFFLKTGNFSGRWLAPVLFVLPLAMFSIVEVKAGKKALKLYGFLCAFIALSILTARAFIGFFPDAAGKVERIHIPYKVLSQQLIEKLGKKGMSDFRDLAVIADFENEYIAANIIAILPETKFVSLNNFVSDRALHEDVMNNGGILVCDISRHGGKISKSFTDALPSSLPIEMLQAPYIRSTKFPPYVIGVAIIPKKENPAPAVAQR